jgi:hypothetical protein
LLLLVAAIHRVKARVDSVESIVDSLEPPVDFLEPGHYLRMHPVDGIGERRKSIIRIRPELHDLRFHVSEPTLESRHAIRQILQQLHLYAATTVASSRDDVTPVCA